MDQLSNEATKNLIEGARLIKAGIELFGMGTAEFESKRSGMNEYTESQTLNLIRRLGRGLPIDVP